MSENPRQLNDVFESYGLDVIISTANARLARQYGNIFPDGASIGECHFFPEGRQDHDPSHVSSSFLDLFKGFDVFFKAVDNGFPKPEYFIGTTNQPMAAFLSRRLGFRTEDISPDVLDQKEKIFSFVGKTDEIKQKLAKIMAKSDASGRTIIGRLQQRTGS